MGVGLQDNIHKPQPSQGNMSGYVTRSLLKRILFYAENKSEIIVVCKTHVTLARPVDEMHTVTLFLFSCQLCCFEKDIFAEYLHIVL